MHMHNELLHGGLQHVPFTLGSSPRFRRLKAEKQVRIQHALYIWVLFDRYVLRVCFYLVLGASQRRLGRHDCRKRASGVWKRELMNRTRA